MMLLITTRWENPQEELTHTKLTGVEEQELNPWLSVLGMLPSLLTQVAQLSHLGAL